MSVVRHCHGIVVLLRMQGDLERQKSLEEELKEHMEGIKLQTNKMDSERAALQQKTARIKEKLQKVCVTHVPCE